MRIRPTLMLLSVFVAPGIAVAAEPGASGAHPVAPELQSSTTSQPATPALPPAPVPGGDAGPRMKKRWYGWQIIAVDAATLFAVLGVGTALDWQEEATVYTALGGYLVGGPITHLAHGKPLRSVGSLGLRAGGLALGGLGYLMADGCRHGCYEPLIGGAIGIATAMIVDVAVLGYEEVPVEPRALQNVGVSLGRDHAAFVVGGRF